MKIRSGNDTVGAGYLDGDLSPGVACFIANFGRRPRPVDAQQVRTVVKRLRVLLGEGNRNAKRCGVELNAAQLVRVCDDLQREAQEPDFCPDYGSTVEGFILSGIFDELGQQPSNIFDLSTNSQGQQYYVPLSAEKWTTYLETLRLSRYSIADEQPAPASRIAPENALENNTAPLCTRALLLPFTSVL